MRRVITKEIMTQHPPQQLYMGSLREMVGSWRDDLLWFGPFCVVYWLEPADYGDLTVYIGKTWNLPARLAKHRKRHWWPDVVQGRYFYFPCANHQCSVSKEEIALAWEAWGIKLFNPYGNLAQPISPI